MALFKRISILMLLLTLISCGDNEGGFTDTTTGTGTTTDGTDTTDDVDDVTTQLISLVRSAREVSGDAPITITATVTDGGGVVADEVVEFSTSIASLFPVSGLALTDENGVATIELRAGNVKGAGTVSAVTGEGAEGEINFYTYGDDINIVGEINVTLELLDSEGNATDSITASKPGKVIATVDGITNPVVVTFSGAVGDFPIPTAVTIDNNGVFQATADIYAGDSIGAGVITASLSSGEIGSTILVVGSSSVSMGSNDGSNFQEGRADTSKTTLSAGGTSVISVEIRDDQGNLYTERVDVEFTSVCTTNDPATASLSTPVRTSNGIATSTYLAKGCVGNDTINVTANAGGINLSASATINVLPADVGSIVFDSATPEYLGIKGVASVGKPESSTILFRVFDTNGNPAVNTDVNFSLVTDVGDITINPTTATTNDQGLVQTVVNSGTAATSVSVSAIVLDSDGAETLIATQSKQLAVTTGIPDQDSFDLSVDKHNVEGWSYSGEEVQVTARLADAFNNPAPDGTVVTFTTEGGRIEPSCQTVNGDCSVVWNSQGSRPEGHVLGDANNPGHLPEVYNSMGQKYGGRVTVTARALGEESYADTNGNGRFDADEMALFLANDVGGDTFDLKEAFEDYNEDGYFNPGEAGAPADPTGSGDLEELIDFNYDGIFNPKDNKYNGVLCSIPAHAGCSDVKSTYITQNTVIIMSGSTAYTTIVSTDDSSVLGNPNDNTINIEGESVGSVTFIVADLHNQPMPEGTKITATTSAGSIANGSEFTWGSDSHNGGLKFTVSIKGAKEAATGSLYINIETPNGSLTQMAPISVVIAGE